MVAIPEHFPLLYESLEAAQRAADDVLINYRPHDCQQLGCGAWIRIESPSTPTPQTPM